MSSKVNYNVFGQDVESCATKKEDLSPKNGSITLSDKGYYAVLADGVPYPPFIDLDVLKDLQQRSALRGGAAADVVVATFPKCGTTWMQQIVLSLLAGGDANKVRRPMQMSKWPERHCSTQSNVDEWIGWSPPAEEQKYSPTRRVIKTHAPVKLAPWPQDKVPSEAKIIVVCRNPKDVAVSLYHHTIDGTAFKYTGDWDHFAEHMFLPGLVESGSFWEFYASWWKEYQQHPERIFWISYEDLKKAPDENIRKIAEFCNIPVDDDIIAKVQAGSSFSKMKTTAEEENQKIAKEGGHVKKNHFRKGKTGGWRDAFSKQQIEMYDKFHEQKCKDVGLPLKLFDFGN
eukprot:m.41591 g.41591  ORF g.41591 m.41591 type:complete len:343 (-) comp9784_c1_seq1:48-1076(-)